MLLLAGALLLRVGWVLHLSVDESRLALLPDQVEYLELGKNLLHSHELRFFDARFGATTWAYRTPGYPALIALCRADIRAVRLAQAILDTSTILAIYILARRWLSGFACDFACFLVAVNPFLIYFTGLILSETLFIAMLAWGMALLAQPKWRASMIGVFVLSLSPLVRPSALLLPILLTLPHWRKAIFALAMILLVLFPWAARNHARLGRWIWTTTNSGITQYDGFNPHADGSSDQDFITGLPQLAAMSEVERSDYLSHLAHQFITEHPGTAIALAMRKIGRTWSPIPLSREYGGRSAYVIAAAFYSIPLDLLVLAGLCRGKIPRAAKVFLLIPAIYFTAVHAISVGSLRYRIPAEVPLAIVSCSWLVVSRKDPQVASTKNHQQLSTD